MGGVGIVFWRENLWLDVHVWVCGCVCKDECVFFMVDVYVWLCNSPGKLWLPKLEELVWIQTSLACFFSPGLVASLLVLVGTWLMCYIHETPHENRNLETPAQVFSVKHGRPFWHKVWIFKCSFLWYEFLPVQIKHWIKSRLLSLRIKSLSLGDYQMPKHFKEIYTTPKATL